MLYYIRLLSGEDLLAEATIANDIVSIKTPVRIVVSQVPGSEKLNVGLVPWPQFTGDKEIVLQREHVIFLAEPLPEFKAQYTKMFGGLLLPDTNGKLILPKS